MAGDNEKANEARKKLQKKDRTRKNKALFDRTTGKDKDHPVPGSEAWARKKGLK
jgi:hypothetical protein